MEIFLKVRGITYNKVTSLNEGPAVVIATWLIAVISVLLVLSRLGIKCVVIRKMQVDDYFIIGAMVFGIAQSAVVSQQVQNGLGDYINPVNNSDRISFQQSYYAASILYIPSICLAKLSSLAFIHGLTPYDNHIKVIRYAGLATILLGTASVFSIAFQCGLPHPWEVTSRHCFNQTAFWTWVGVWDVMTDLAILFLPILLVIHLRTSVSRKLIVLACFSGRVLSIVAIVLRVLYLTKYPTSDVANLWKAVICTQVEQGISISLTSIPYMRPLFEALESGVWRSDELRRRGLVVEDIYGEGFLKSWQIGIARNTAYLELNPRKETKTSNKGGITSHEHGLFDQIH